MNPFAWSGLLAGVSSLGFGSLVLLKSRSRKLGLIWFLFSLSVAVWGFSCTLLPLISKQGPKHSLLFLKTTYALGVVWMPVFFHHFVSRYCETRANRILAMNYMVALLYLALMPTSLFISGVEWAFDSMFFIQSGVLYTPFFLWWMGICVYSHIQLIRFYKRAGDLERSQTRCLIVGTTIGFGGGSMAFCRFLELMSTHGEISPSVFIPCLWLTRFSSTSGSISPW